MLKAILRWLWLMPEQEKRAGDITLYGNDGELKVSVKGRK